MKKNLFNTFIAMLVMTLLISSCQKNVLEIAISDDKQIDELMEEQNLTEFLNILDKSGILSTVHAYGNYALFAPTNDAVASYLQQLGKGSVSNLTNEEAAEIVRYHLLNVTDIADSVTTAGFVNGRMPYPNFSGSYLTTKQEGEAIRVNRQALILSPLNIKASNGHLHVIDRVLTPPDPVTESITARLRSLPDNFSLMKEVFERSGMAETLAENVKGEWKTLFIQDNDAFAEAGISNIDELIADLRLNTPAIDDENTLLYNYMAYRTIPRLQYVADLLGASSFETMVKNQVITFSRKFGETETKVLLNEITELQELGVELDRNSEFSDWSCSNGVLQKISGNIQIKVRSAYRIYWDIAEQPEIVALRNFRKPGCDVQFNVGDLSEITWQFKSSAPARQQQIGYYCGTIPQNIAAFDAKSQYVYGDYLRFCLDPGAIQWMEMKTPVLIGSEEGIAYKIWFCWRRELECDMKTTFKQEGKDDQILPYIFDLAVYGPVECRDNPQLAEQDGWKMYNAKRFESVFNSHLLGTIKVYTTGRHTLRLEPTRSRRVGQLGSVDMIQFIPVDEDQLWPRVDVRGNWIGPEVPTCEIWPPEECAVEEEP
jgi:Secreted and surface protein containing fasciclin-like repeats